MAASIRRMRMAYEVVREIGMESIPIGYKRRLLGKRRAERVFQFLLKRGIDVRIRCFGKIYMPESPRLFD